MRCGADDRQAPEQLRRDITRSVPGNVRVQGNTAAQVMLKPKTPRRDGTTHVVMSPLEPMQRLATQVPPRSLASWDRGCSNVRSLADSAIS